jgi:hypothetical protein
MHLLKIMWSRFLLTYFFGGNEIWTQGLHLQCRCSTAWTMSPSPLCSGYFGDGVLRTICPRWPQTTILPISASQTARITSVSHSAWLSLCVHMEYLKSSEYIKCKKQGAEHCVWYAIICKRYTLCACLYICTQPTNKVLFILFLFYSYVHTMFGSFPPPSPRPLPYMPLPPFPLATQQKLFCPYL